MSDEGRDGSTPKRQVSVDLFHFQAFKRLSQITKVPVRVLMREALDDFLHKHAGAQSADEINNSRLAARRAREETQLGLFSKRERVAPPRRYFDDDPDNHTQPTR